MLTEISVNEVHSSHYLRHKREMSIFTSDSGTCGGTIVF